VLPVRGGVQNYSVFQNIVLPKRSHFAAIFIMGVFLHITKTVKNSNMPKGIKHGGRKAGTGNKISAALKEVLNEYCLNEFQFLNANIERLTLHERIILFSKVLPFVLPKNGVLEANTGEAAKVPIIIFSDKK